MNAIRLAAAGIAFLGTVGRGSHTDDEDLEIASIERNAIRAAIFIHRLLGTARSF